MVDSQLLNTLSEQAKSSPRLRMNLDLRNSAEDKSQRMLNALEPGTQIPIHRHCASSETVAVLRGSVRQNFYNDAGELTLTFVVQAGSDCPFFIVPKGAWHNSEALEPGTIIFEAKDGPYEPLGKEDVMEIK